MGTGYNIEVHNENESEKICNPANMYGPLIHNTWIKTLLKYG